MRHPDLHKLVPELYASAEGRSIMRFVRSRALASIRDQKLSPAKSKAYLMKALAH